MSNRKSEGSSVREHYETKFGDEITITGTDGGKWSIYVSRVNFMMVQTIYPNRVLCQKEARTKYPKKRDL